MPRPPEIGNVQLYPDRPLKSSDKNGYVLKFYCPINSKRIRKNCGTRDRREARRVLRECRERLLNGEYLASGGAITAQQSATRQQIKTILQPSESSSGPNWDDCYDRYRKHYAARSRDKSTADAISRLSICSRVMENAREEGGLPEGGPIGEYLSLDSLEQLQERLLQGDESKYDSRAPTTVNTTIGAVMAFARFCYRHGWIDKIPPLTKLSVDEVMKGRPICEAEFAAMIEATPEVVGKRAAHSWQFLLQVLWESGFRIGDSLNFSWDDECHIHPVWPEREAEFPTLVVPSTQKNKKAQEIPMLPGLQSLLGTVDADRRSGWVVHPLQPAFGEAAFKPPPADLARLAGEYTNTAIANACHVSETAVRKWLEGAGLEASSHLGNRQRHLPAEETAAMQENTDQNPSWTRCGVEHRPTKEWVGRIISQIGEKAGIVVQQKDPARGKRIKYASAHDIRRGCAQRLINAGVSAETLKIVMRHKDFATTERYYGATRQAQSAASEIHQKLPPECQEPMLVGVKRTPKLSADELCKLRALLNSL